MLAGAIMNLIGSINFFKYKLIVGKDNVNKMFNGDQNKIQRKKSILALIHVLIIVMWAFAGTSAGGESGFIAVTIFAFILNNGLTVLIAIMDKKAYLESINEENIGKTDDAE